MAILKCKMCGGDIILSEDKTFGTCDSCGSTMTFPKVSDEHKLNLYNRANHFRRQNEFDKAIAAYDKILDQDDTDAEAHWGAVLSRYGIEYVEDPATHERIPTCHRVQPASILADEDYKAAVEYAPDAESRRLYEEEAARIAEIQKGILAISQHEKAYDVFICYKETDDNGQRTHDSQWAQDVYYGLTEQGYKVFFSRITLEDKLGQEYEPYIFAALNSARVMVVIGSKPEYFNAVWVKNEWSRYLALMAKDRKRLLIPCYRDMDPYDLPDELSSLQSQDMSKIGFMQDLIRGVRKVLDADKAAGQPKVVQQVVQAGTAGAAPSVSSLMDRAYLFMEDGDFDSAEEYLNRVLDIDPKHAPAYAAKVCVAFHIRKEAGLADATFQFEDNADWQKALRFANPEQKVIYEGYSAKVRNRVSIQIRNYAYDCAVEMAVVPGSDRGKLDSELATYKTSCIRSNGSRANGNRRTNSQKNEATFDQAVRTNEPGDVSEQNLKTAANMFEAIKDDEAVASAKKCRALAEQARQKAVYINAVSMHSREKSPSGLEETAKLFLSIPEYKDAKSQAQRCANEAESIRAGLYSDAVNAMNAAGSESSKWDIAKKKLREYELNGYRDVETLRANAVNRFYECLAAEQDAKQREEERLRRQAEEAAAKKAAERDAKQREEERLRQQAEAAAAKKKRNTILGVLSVVAVIAAMLVVTLVIIPRKNKETKYLQAKALAAAGDYAGAVTVFSGIEGYKDVDNLLANDHNLVSAAAARDAKYSVGNYITFGHYPQTSAGNDNTSIEWLVLARDGKKALLLSRYGLDAKPYNEKYVNITWEKCTLRTWLNGTFLNKAFTTQEQKGILLTNVDNSKSQGYSKWNTNGGNNTQDKIFLLSYAESNKYLGVTYDNSSNTKSRVEPTAYALKQGAYTADGSSAGRWWLRSPGDDQNLAARVHSDGYLESRGVHNDSGCVRPALWINLESDIF